MLTAENFRANMETAKRKVMAEQKLDPTKVSEWTYDERWIFNRALAERVTLYPTSFSPEQLEIARQFLDQRKAPLQDEGFAFGEFAAETVKQAKIVLPAFNRWLLGIALAAGIIYLIFVSSAARQNLRP